MSRIAVASDYPRWKLNFFVLSKMNPRMISKLIELVNPIRLKAATERYLKFFLQEIFKQNEPRNLKHIVFYQVGRW